MIVKRSGGMTEFIPSPSEKRDGVIRNHVLDLLANLDKRLRRIEEAAGLPADLADEFGTAMARIENEEMHIQWLNEQLITTGINVPSLPSQQSTE